MSKLVKICNMTHNLNFFFISMAKSLSMVCRLQHTRQKTRSTIRTLSLCLYLLRELLFQLLIQCVHTKHKYCLWYVNLTTKETWHFLLASIS